MYGCKMDALSLHLSFQLKEDPIKSEELWKILHELPSKCIGDVTLTSDVKTVSGDRILVTTSPDGSHLVMHVYRHGLVTLDIQFVGKHPLEKTMNEKVKFPNIKRLENEIKTSFGDKCKYTRIIPARLQRGKLCPYFITSDQKLFEAVSSIKLLAEKDSKWQNIKIYSTEEFGAMMALDDDLNEWDDDDDYNATLLGTSRYSYDGKTVLILGAGGGGLLADLKELSPKYVVLVEDLLALFKFRLWLFGANDGLYTLMWNYIEVYKLCRQYMKHAVQELEGPNYKILIEDCQKVLKDYHEAGVKFDFIVNDLPEKILNVDEEADDNSSEPESNILTSSMKVLAQDGKYLCRGGCITEFELLDVIERTVTKHPTGLTFKKFVVDIPAVNEKFCFYEVTRKNELTNGSA